MLGFVLLLGWGVAAFVATRSVSGPFPSDADLRTRGFAAWPVDTVAEAERECADPDEWRLDARSTALRFARQILRYPEPHTSDWSDEQEHRERFLVGSEGVEDLFLGSLLETTRYGRCWYVTGGYPREGDVGATVGFVYRDGDPYLLLSHAPEVPPGYVGFGDWEAEVDAGLRQTIMWLPEIDAGATGHAIYTRPDEDGVSESVGVEIFGFIPPQPDGPPAEPLDSPTTVLGDPGACRGPLGFKTPELAIRHLYAWQFDYLLQQVRGHPRFQRKGWRQLGGDRWRLVVDDAVLTATIPKTAAGCYTLLSLVPAGDPPLRRLWVDEASVTFGIDWGGGDEALVSFGSGVGFSRTLKELQEPVTFTRAPGEGPVFAGVILYKDGHVVSAYYAPFSV